MMETIGSVLLPLEMPLEIHHGFAAGLVTRLGLLTYPLLAFSSLLQMVLSIALVAAVVFAAWKVGSYYDSAKRKL
jgi:hypothetical protein